MALNAEGLGNVGEYVSVVVGLGLTVGGGYSVKSHMVQLP